MTPRRRMLFGGNPLTAILNAFKTRVSGDGGTTEAESCLTQTIATLKGNGLYDKASLIITPNSYKASKIYALKPTDGSVNLTFTRASAKNRRNLNGAIEALANNVPALEYPVGGGCPAWLLEPQRTNLVLQSNTFNTLWANTNLNITPNYEVTLYDASRITSTGAAAKRISQTVTTVVGQTYIMHVRLKNAVPGVSNKLNFGNLAIGYTTINTTDSWELYTHTFIATSTSSPIGLVEFNYATSYDILAYNIQCELGSYATSPIVTTSATVTRVQDNDLSIPVPTSLNCAFYFEAEYSGSSNQEYSIKLEWASGARYVGVYHIGKYIYDIGAGVVVGGTTLAVHTKHKFLINYDGTNFKWYADAVLVYSLAVTPTLPYYLLRVFQSNNPFQSRIGNILKYHQSLTPAECIALTTL